MSPDVATRAGCQFIQDIFEGRQPEIEFLIKVCGGFEPRLLLNLFFKSISRVLRDLGLGHHDMLLHQGATSSLQSQDVLRQFRLAELSNQCLAAVHQCNSHITIYNQGIAAALELLASDISLLVKKYRGGAII